MKAGGKVVVKNGIGAQIAEGQLGEGVGTGTGYIEPGHVPYADACKFAFMIANVPDAAQFVVEVHRGAWSYSKSDLESNNWTVALIDDSNVAQ